MRKTKSYCPGCFKPKKMEFRAKGSSVSSASAQTTTFTNAPTRIELERNKLAQAVKNRPVKKPNTIRSFSKLQTIQKKQTVTLH